MTGGCGANSWWSRHIVAVAIELLFAVNSGTRLRQKFRKFDAVREIG